MTKPSWKIYVKNKFHGEYKSLELWQAALKKLKQDKTIKSSDISCHMCMKV